MKTSNMARFAPVFALVLVAGCSNNAAMEQLRADLDSTRQAAAMASQDAAEAKRTANAALQAAELAQERATAARNSAQRAAAKADAAQQCCEANRERMDRVFRQSQLK